MPTPTMVLFKTVLSNDSWNEPFLLTTKQKFIAFCYRVLMDTRWLTERSCLWLILVSKTVHLQPLRGTQSSKQGMWKGSHLLKKESRTFSVKNGKSTGLDLRAEPTRMKLCWVPPGTQTCFHCSGYRFKRTKLSLFDPNLFINIQVMYSAPSVMFSVFSFLSFLFFFLGKVLLVLI